MKNELLTIRDASIWASEYLKKNVTDSNISYLIQYGKINKYGDNGNACISKADLKQYYDSYYGRKEINWKDKLGDDLDWHLSFDHLKETDTTKHVHRLHPYKGKFIPQLVEYFLDHHTDEFKTESYFNRGDIILDPFCGSGTTLVQANELGMHAVGVDISIFNSFISNVKISKYDFIILTLEINNITRKLYSFISESNAIPFESDLLKELAEFNNKYFPSPEFKIKLNKGLVNEEKYGQEKEKEFLPVYNKLIKQYDIHLKQKSNGSFLDKWYIQHVREEIEYLHALIKKIKNQETKNALTIILSRTIRSCRATTHSDLATLIDPILTPYYCAKHGKICKPLFSIARWWDTYSKDTIKRLAAFDKLRSNTHQLCLTADSRNVNIIDEVKQINPDFGKIIKSKKIHGIFSSPPYVGLIDYHEQHAYAYDLFGFKRKDDLEIGPLYNGSGREARESYVKGISEVLNNCKPYLAKDYNIFLVANDKYKLYPTIAENAGMQIVRTYKRPVLNRTEKDKNAYSEIIFHLKEK